ncbi:hypothetical protein JCM24511_06975 [Saitozyma sp. JCM 24511]|nr:hypothetical protein JCM24511_06975 [Saitozyma sp. JCM 24511]
MYSSELYPGAALIATGLSLHGYRKGSLSRSGAIAAWVVGYGHLANPLKLFGTTMIVFYLVGSRATKVKAQVKATLEDGPDPSKPGGNRNAIQILSNSLPSLLAALAYRFSDAAKHFVHTVPIGRGLIFAALGHLSCCLADTLASELGILSTSPPRSILTLTPVPPGTNGGISPLGLAVSALGGGLIGLAGVVDLLIESPALRSGATGWGWAGEMVLFCTAAGLAGSLLDSLLGATLQETLYSTKEGKILTDLSTRQSRSEPGVKRIGIGRDVLSNSAVNFVSGFAIAAAGWWYATKL